jgi:hypothetical protein
MLNGTEREALQVGDKVGVSETYRAAILTVTRRTKARLTLSDGSAWTVGRGRKVGTDSWSGACLVKPEDAAERIAEIKEQRAVRDAADRLARHRWRDMTSEQLARFIALLDEIKPSAP